MSTQASLYAHHHNVRIGYYTTKAARIYKIIKAKGVVDLNQLKDLLNEDKSNFSSVVATMNDKGILFDMQKNDRTLYRLTFENEIESVVRRRSEKKYKTWLKQGFDNDYFTRLNGDQIFGSEDQ